MDREIDWPNRQTDRHRKAQTTGRQTGRHTYIHTYIHTDRQTDRNIKYKKKEINILPTETDVSSAYNVVLYKTNSNVFCV